MNLKLDAIKDNTNGHIMLTLELSVVGEDVGKFVIPIGNDLVYALYKGVNLDLKHLDCILSAYGQEAKAKALEAQEAQNGSKEQVEAIEGSAPAGAENPVCD